MVWRHQGRENDASRLWRAQRSQVHGSIGNRSLKEERRRTHGLGVGTGGTSVVGWRGWGLRRKIDHGWHCSGIEIRSWRTRTGPVLTSVVWKKRRSTGRMVVRGPSISFEFPMACQTIHRTGVWLGIFSRAVRSIRKLPGHFEFRTGFPRPSLGFVCSVLHRKGGEDGRRGRRREKYSSVCSKGRVELVCESE